MIASGLRKWAKELGIQVSNGKAYGEVDGYTVTLSEGLGNKNLGVSFVSQGDDLAAITGTLQSIGRANKVLNVFYCDYGVMICFQDTPGVTLPVMKKALDVLLESLKEHGASGARNCLCCGQAMAPDSNEYIDNNGIMTLIHTACRDFMNNGGNAWPEIASTDVLGDEEPLNVVAVKEPKGNWALGTVGAIVGALVGAIPWGVAYYFGWVFGLFGFLIGFCSMKGYGLLHNQSTWNKLVSVLLSTIVVVVVVQFFGACVVAWDMLNAKMGEGSLEAAGVTFPQHAELMFNNIISGGEYALDFVMNLGMGLFFAFLGLFDIIKQINIESKINKRMD